MWGTPEGWPTPRDLQPLVSHCEDGGLPWWSGSGQAEVSEAEGGRLVAQFCPELSWRMVVQGEQRAREDLGDATVLAEV